MEIIKELMPFIKFLLVIGGLSIILPIIFFIVAWFKMEKHF